MPDKYILHYFNGTALGEPVRFLLSHGGLDWEDVRYDCELRVEDGIVIPVPDKKWIDFKHKTPFGQLPLLEINGETYAQSTSISRYLGKLVGLAGADDLENLKIDIAIDTFHDLRLKIVSWFYDPILESKTAKKDPLMKEQIPLYLGKLNQLVEENGGYLVNGKLTWGDLYLAAPFHYLNALVGTDLLEPYPGLRQLVDKVHALPRIAEYIAKRPTTPW